MQVGLMEFLVAELETQISLKDIAQQYGISADALTRLTQDGIIRANHSEEEKTVSVSTVAAAASVLRREVRPEQYKHLRGRRIRVNEAAAKYDVPPPNISRWIKLEYIQVLGSGFQRTEIDEADIAYISAAYKRAIEITESSIRAGWTLRRLMQTG
jgi:transposase-like protein